MARPTSSRRSCTTCDAGSERIQLSAFADGWSTRFETIVAIDGDSTPAVELALEGVEMRLVGRVTDTRGQPIAGVTVAVIPARSEMIGAGDGNLLRPLRHSAITRGDGRFTIGWIPRERPRLQVMRQGFSRAPSTLGRRLRTAWRRATCR